MSKSLIAFTAVAFAVSAAPELRAQDASALGAGVRVRLVTPRIEADQQVGKVVTSTTDTIVFRSDVNPITRSIPVAEIASIDVSDGKRMHRGRDGAIGAFLGLGVGAIIGATGPKPSGVCFIVCDT